MGEEAIAGLLEDSEVLLAEDFAVKLCDIECEYGLMSVQEEKDDNMEVSQGEDVVGSGKFERLQVEGDKSWPKPRPLTKVKAITIDTVKLEEDKNHMFIDSEIAEVCPHSSKVGLGSFGGSKHKRSLEEVEVKMEQMRGGGGQKVCHKLS